MVHNEHMQVMELGNASELTLGFGTCEPEQGVIISKNKCGDDIFGDWS